jgi:putative toxin-antitoxin system antitoxin component (TIGR02293 family)
MATDGETRAERLARIKRLARRVWEDAELAEEFLTSVQPQLGGRPVDLIQDEAGARRVEALLMRIEHALPV